MIGPLVALDRLVGRLPSPRLVRFALVGTSGVAVNFAVLALLEALLPSTWGFWRHRVAMGTAIGVSVLTNFLLHDAWTWADRGKDGSTAGWLGRIGRFYVVSLLAAGLQWVVAVLTYEQAIHRILALDRILGPLGPFVAQAVGIVAGTVLNFTANHLWTFHGHPGTGSARAPPSGPAER
ncbi:MAG: GtrA family protein [Deltaproteobacteria bacterium]|nr:GtrA family protein [Deltaproteobacteria bacterium]